MKHSWLVLYKITHYDNFGNKDSIDWRWELYPSLVEARSFKSELMQKHNDGGTCYGSSVSCSILRTIECE